MSYGGAYRCYNCGKSGHYATKCPAPKKTYSSSSSSSSPSGTICYNCKQPGHYKEKCPHPPRPPASHYSNSNGTSKPPPTCYKCGVVGHYSTTCPQNPNAKPYPTSKPSFSSSSSSSNDEAFKYLQEMARIETSSSSFSSSSDPSSPRPTTSKSKSALPTCELPDQDEADSLPLQPENRIFIINLDGIAIISDRANPTSFRSSSMSSSSSANYLANVTCYKCSQKGHYSTKCTAPYVSKKRKSFDPLSTSIDAQKGGEEETEESVKKYKEAEESAECVVCLVNKREYLCYPCGHLCLCKQCHIAILKTKKCPLCNDKGKCEKIIRVFDS